MSGLQIALSLIGVLLILAIIGHGMWTIRNNDKAVSKQQQELARKRQQRDAEGFDVDGIGSVRVVKEVPNSRRSVAAEPESAPAKRSSVSADNTSTPAHNDVPADAELSDVRPTPADPEHELELPEPMRADTRTPEPAALEPMTAEPMVPEPTIPRSGKPPAATKTSSAAAAPEQIGLGIDEVTEVEGVTTAPDEVIVLHVKGDIQGAVLLQQMTELGFKYGDFDIFHRHETTAGTGPVLFSLANMFNPGTFDIYAMETFKTEGLALFLALPVKGSAQQAFTMMHNAAQKIATAIGGGQVLDEHRNPLTRQTVQHIVQRIREYERRQLLRQHGG